MDRTVMVVDDDAIFRDYITAFLEKHGYKVTVAESWMDFSRAYYAMKEHPDMILFDVNLGGVMTGDKIVQALKRKETSTSDKGPPPKLVLISSCSEEEMKSKAARVRADGYISKDALKVAGGAAFINKMRSIVS